MQELYRHRALQNPRSIRVMELHPGTRSSTICCHLTEVSLDDKPQYHALSYVWGDAEDRCAIECEGCRLLVTHNCFAALHELRDNDKHETLWIDSVCIDQTSSAERSQQVALMGEIYTNARTVAAWLGECDASTERAMDKIAELTNIGEHAPEVFQSVLHWRVDMMKSDTKSPADDIIGSIFRRSWFGRLWTTQEVVLAQGNKVVLYCGHKNLPWMSLFTAADALRVRQYPYGQHEKAMQLQKYLNYMIMAERIPFVRQMLEAKPGNIVTKPYVSHILMYAREKASSEPKDKVFALLGIFNELGIKFPILSYSDSVEDIYREATVMAIEHDKELFVLTQAPSDHRHFPALASWVPDWSDVGFRGSDPRTAITRSRFAAAGPSNETWKFSADRRRLILSGKLLDTVIYRTEALDMKLTPEWVKHLPLTGEEGLRTFKHDLKATFHIMKTWAQVSSWYAEYPTGESVQTALKRTLVSDDPQTLSEVDSENAFDAWYHIMLTNDNPTAEAEAVESHPLSSNQEERHTLSIFRSSTALSYHHRATVFSNKKCFFTTANGFMGTGPDLIQPDDRIAIVAGLTMPLILRPAAAVADGDGYRLVTHAYVHGMMYGDYWPSPENENDLEPIILV